MHNTALITIHYISTTTEVAHKQKLIGRPGVSVQLPGSTSIVKYIFDYLQHFAKYFDPSYVQCSPQRLAPKQYMNLRNAIKSGIC